MAVSKNCNLDISNPFSKHKLGLVSVHSGHLIIRGNKHSQKAGFLMKRFCVLIFDNQHQNGYILCFKTKNHWKVFENTHSDSFLGNKNIVWSELQKDNTLDNMIALKDAHIDSNTLPQKQTESFIQQSNEIFIQPRDKNSVSLTDDSLVGHYLIFENDYNQWIEHMQKMAHVEKKAIQFTENINVGVTYMKQLWEQRTQTDTKSMVINNQNCNKTKSKEVNNTETLKKNKATEEMVMNWCYEITQWSNYHAIKQGNHRWLVHKCIANQNGSHITKKKNNYEYFENEQKYKDWVKKYVAIYRSE
eukprot:81728_1